MIPPWLKSPSAFVPVAMSLIALLLVVLHAAIFGITHQSDSSPVSLIFEIVMTAQLPVILFLAVTRLRSDPKPTVRILLVQAAAGFIAICADILLT